MSSPKRDSATPLEAIHPYFLKRKPVEWSIRGFLLECNDHVSFGRKLDVYVKSIVTIINIKEGEWKKSAQILFDSYKKGGSGVGNFNTIFLFDKGTRPDRQIAKQWWWEEEKSKQEKSTTESSVYLHKPTFVGNPLVGTGPFNIGGDSTGSLVTQVYPDSLPREECDEDEVWLQNSIGSNERKIELSNKHEWILPSGISVAQIFETYKCKPYMQDLFAHSHIFELEENAPVHAGICEMEGQGTWDEIVADNYSYQSKMSKNDMLATEFEYLSQLNKPTTEEIREALWVPFCTKYNSEEHYNLDYIHMTFRKFAQFFEFTHNPLLDAGNSEGYLQVHLYGQLIDSLFLDLKEVKIVRGEQGSRAVSYRKNLQRHYGAKKLYPAKLDSVLRTRDTWARELLVVESGKYDSLEGQTKFMSDRYKIARGLKDQIDYLYMSLPSEHRDRIVDMEVFGVLTSGMEGTVYVMNLPCSGVYKFAKLFQFELPQTVEGIGQLAKTVARFLILKQRVRAVLCIIKEVYETTPLDVLSGRIVWSPVSKKTIPTRKTPSTPTHEPRKRKKT